MIAKFCQKLSVGAGDIAYFSMHLFAKRVEFVFAFKSFINSSNFKLPLFRFSIENSTMSLILSKSFELAP